MRKSEYNEKIQSLISDRHIYRLTQDDPTETLERKNNNWVRALFKLNIICKKEKDLLLCSKAAIPRLYGCPKTHKSNVPLRPIVNSINSPSYHLSKYIGSILNKISIAEYNVPNSYKLKELLYTIEIPKDYTIVSYDVINLFTSIPIHKINEVIIKRWNEISKFTNISDKMFIKILDFCVRQCNYFSYDNQIYVQQEGVAMGNPLAPTLANLIMDDLFEETLKHVDSPPILFVKYVDDCLAIIKEDQVNMLLNVLNNYHSKIKFTVELENLNKINFLDIEIIRIYEEERIITNWYTKSIASGRIINFNSLHPWKYKVNIVKELINRISNLSDPSLIKDNIDKAYDILQQNDYPLWFIRNVQNRHKDKIKIFIEPVKKETVIYKSLTYVPGLSDSLTKMFRKQLKNVTIAHKLSHNINQLFTKLKDQIPTENKSDVVYKIDCKNCNATYIGQTGRNLKYRVNEHKNGELSQNINTNVTNRNLSAPVIYSPIQRKGRIYTPKKQTDVRNVNALTLHAKESQHQFDFSDVKILHKEQNSKRRLILETIEITRHQNACNLKKDLEALNSTYLDLILK